MNSDVQAALETTTEILQNPTEILNVEPSKIDAALQSLIQGAIHFGVQLLVAILIFSVGIWLSNKITRSIKKLMQIRDFDPSLQSFLGSFINIILKIFVFIIVLTTVGVQMTSIVAVLGAASLAIGMALSGTMQNFAGGIIILALKPFKVGDTIITASGHSGVVKKIKIFTTELHTFDNRVVYLPNGALSGGEIINISHGDVRRTDLTVSISYGDSVAVARREILKILAADSRIRKTPEEPSVFVAELGDSAVVLTVRFWTKYTDALPTGADMLEKIYETLPKKKLHFPFPQMDVHVVK